MTLTQRQMFHLKRGREKAHEAKTLRVKHPSPKDVLLSHLAKRGWNARKLADRLSQGDDDKARDRLRGVIAHYLAGRAGSLELGPIFCSRLDEALALPRDTFRKIERAWVNQRKALNPPRQV